MYCIYNGKWILYSCITRRNILFIFIPWITFPSDAYAMESWSVQMLRNELHMRLPCKFPYLHIWHRSCIRFSFLHLSSFSQFGTMGGPDLVSSSDMHTLIFQILIVKDWERFLIWALQPVFQPVALSIGIVANSNGPCICYLEWLFMVNLTYIAVRIGYTQK